MPEYVFIPEALEPYVDYEKWARDCELSGDLFTVAHFGDWKASRRVARGGRD